MRRSPAVLALIAVIALLPACGESSPAAVDVDVTEVRVSGSGTAMPLVQKLAEEYERSHPGMRFVFEAGTNSGGAITGVQEGTLDLAVVNRTLRPEEDTNDVTYVALARDAVGFAVGPGIEVSDISTADVHRVYAGEVTDWSQLGLASHDLVVLDRDPDESARKEFLVPMMAGQEVEARAAVLAKASEMADALAGTPGALGYTAVGYLSAKGVDGVRMLSLDGVAPTADTVAAGTYPWFLTLGLVRSADGPAALEGFVDFVSGPQADAILEDLGYAPTPT